MLIFVFLSAGGVVGAQSFSNFQTAYNVGFVTSVAVSHGFGLAVAIYAVGEVSGGMTSSALSAARLLKRD